MSFNVSIDEHSCPSSHCEENDAVSGVAFGRDTDSDCSSEASFLNQENGSFERTFSSCTESISPHHRLANDHSYASPSTCGSLVTSESDGEIPPPPPSDCSDFLSEHSLASRCESVDESVPNGIYEEHRSRFHNNFDQNFLSTNKMKQCAGDCSCKSFVGDDDDGISIEVGKRQLDSKINRSDGYLDTAKSVIFRRSCDLNLGVSEAKLLQSQSKIEKGPVARDSLLSIFKIARIFSLRCSLDHWKFFIKYCEVKESDFNRIGPTLPRQDMQRHALCMFECFMRVGAKRYAYSVLVEALKIGKFDRACKTLSKIIDEATLRCAFNQWTIESRMITWHEQTRNKNLRRLRRKVFMAWRGFNADCAARRQTSLLMMIVNRWRLWTEDCIALRRKNYVALMHWASKMLATAFSALKVNADVCKEKKLMSFGSTMFERFDEKNLTRRFSRLRGMQSLQDECTAAVSNQLSNSFKISYRSPDASMVRNRTPNYASRLTNSSRSSSSMMHAKVGSLRRSDQHQNDCRIDVRSHRGASLAENQRLDFDRKNQGKQFWNNRIEGMQQGIYSNYHPELNDWNSTQSNERYKMQEQYQHTTKSLSQLAPGLYSASKKLPIQCTDHNSNFEGYLPLKTGVFNSNKYTSNKREFSNRAGKYVLSDSKPTHICQTFYPMRDENEAAKPKIPQVPLARISIIKEVSILLDEIISALEATNAGRSKPYSLQN